MYDDLWFDPGSDLMAEVVQKLSECISIRRVILRVDRHESYGVEGMNKQILPYLRTPVHDVQVAKKWSNPTILSLVLFAVNGGVNSEAGVRPLDARFGSDDNPYLRLPDSVDSSSITSTWPVVGDFFEEKEDTPRGQAEYLVEEVYLARPEHVLDQVSAHMNRCDAESFICIEAAPGGVPQHNVTSVESTPGVIPGSIKWVHRVSSGHVPAEGSDLTASYRRDRLAERDLDIGRLESQTSLRQRSCGTQAARRSSAAHDASTRLERFDYSWWVASSHRGLCAVPLDRFGGTVEGDRCLWVFDPGGRVVCLV